MGLKWSYESVRKFDCRVGWRNFSTVRPSCSADGFAGCREGILPPRGGGTPPRQPPGRRPQLFVIVLRLEVTVVFTRQVRSRSIEAMAGMTFVILSR
jgi:hypothetical protein